MRNFGNRIIISLAAIVWLTYCWEFYVKPVSGPVYTAAVSEYKNKNYDRSLDLLKKAYRIDPNDTAILSLMGWNYLKCGDAKTAESYFRRAYKLVPSAPDMLLGYAYTELALNKNVDATDLLMALRQKGVNTASVHVAWGTVYREAGRNRDAAREFQKALALEGNEPTALKNLEEILNFTDDLGRTNLETKPLIRPQKLTYLARVEGDYFAWQIGGEWKPMYLRGVTLTPTLPGHFPNESPRDLALYSGWLLKISELGANTIRVYTILPPAFYRALFQFNKTPSRIPLRLLQGIPFGEPPRNDLFNHDYYLACQKEIRETIDVIHGQGDIPFTNSHSGGIFSDNISPWVAGLIQGQTWLSHVVAGNDQLHPDLTSYQGSYMEVPSGSATEIFLAQMINYAAEYEESQYNWQHPGAFLSWPTLDPMRHPTEATFLEEWSMRRARGEHLPNPQGPLDDEDSVALNPMHLRARGRAPAGYFAAYSVFSFYPDFLNLDPGYQEARDALGSNSYFGYLNDLKAHHHGIPLLITSYGVPTSLGIGHFSPAGFNEGGLTEQQQGELLARFTRNIFDAGAAGGMVFEWLDQWFRQSWLVRKFETPPERRVRWTDFMDPAQYYGLLAADPQRASLHRLSGEPSEWAGQSPVYSQLSPRPAQPTSDRYDPARDLKSLYADADAKFLYLRLVVGTLDNDHDGRPDWNEVNYLIGIATAPGRAGLTHLPFIAAAHFPMGVTYAIQLAGPESSRIWVASSYNPYHNVPIEGAPGQTLLVPKLGWKPQITDHGIFEAQLIEPNRRRFGRDGKYYPPSRYDRGILRYGSLNPKAQDYDPLAEWYANVQTNTIDLRIPWNLLYVTDPSSHKIFMGTDQDGVVLIEDTSGFLLAVFSYHPSESSRGNPIMEQAYPIADALPAKADKALAPRTALKPYRWAAWDTPQFALRAKASYALLQKAWSSLPEAPPSFEGSGQARVEPPSGRSPPRSSRLVSPRRK